jgi:hypothetical protein
MAKMTGAQALIESLKREKVKNIFGIIGGALLPVHDMNKAQPTQQTATLVPVVELECVWQLPVPEQQILSPA